MRARPPHLRRVSLCSLVGLATASAIVALAAPSSAAVPIGWALGSTIDGGTSSLGASIASTESTTVVGAPLAAPASGGTSSGTVFVYSSAGGAWTSQPLAPPTPIANGDFGTSVAISGNLIAVGAGGTPPAAYVFAGDAGSYVSAQTWADPASDTNGSFGSGVAVFENPAGPSYVAVTAPGPSGVVYVSHEVDGGWSDPPLELTNPAASSFGLSIAFAGNGQLLVGDPDTSAGQVLVYAPLPDGGWENTGTLPFSLDGGTVEEFGWGLATWNDLAVATAPGTSDDGFNGVAFVFSADDAGVWTQQAVLHGASAESFGNFTPAVNGALIAVGSAINTSTSGAGQVDVWAASNGTWVPVPSATLVGDSYYGQAVGLPRGALFIGDTSATGTGSALFIEVPLYADGGTTTDASTGSDASLGADGSPVATDASGPSPGGADAAPDGGGATTASSGGCSCSSAAHGSPPGLPALFGVLAASWGLVSVLRSRRTPRISAKKRERA